MMVDAKADKMMKEVASTMVTTITTNAKQVVVSMESPRDGNSFGAELAKPHSSPIIVSQQQLPDGTSNCFGSIQMDRGMIVAQDNYIFIMPTFVNSSNQPTCPLLPVQSFPNWANP
jgi:hypothetical protein